MHILKSLLLKLKSAALILNNFQIGLSLNQSVSRTLLKLHILGIYNNLNINSISQTLIFFRTALSALNLINSKNGKVAAIFEDNRLVKNCNLFMKYSQNVVYFGRWNPGSLLNVSLLKKKIKSTLAKREKKYIAKIDGMHKMLLKRKKISLQDKGLPNTMFLANARHDSSYKIINYEFKRLRVPLLNFIPTSIVPTTVDYFAYFNSKSIKTASYILNFLEHSFVKTTLINKKLAFIKAAKIVNAKAY